jgi:predicted DNA-binding protein (UPF0251 family)
MFPPQVVLFKPQGIPAFMLEQVILTVDEYEAVRLIDYDGLDQEKAAERMRISRATCARIMESAHKKIAEALSRGKAIRIEGGSFVLKKNRFRCRRCGHVWDDSDERPSESSGRNTPCPSCKSQEVIDLSLQLGCDPAKGPVRRKGWGRRGRQWTS